MSAYLLGEIADELMNAGMEEYAERLREWESDLATAKAERDELATRLVRVIDSNEERFAEAAKERDEFWEQREAAEASLQIARERIEELVEAARPYVKSRISSPGNDCWERLYDAVEGFPQPPRRRGE